jgi:4-amino-4-deoxy-L-arabinose transferase-like glycosyltransferase
MDASNVTNAVARSRNQWAALATSSFWIAVIAFALRLGLIFFGHTYKFYNHNHNFSFGWEMGSIGRSLADGEGFSSPFGPETGPTAWEPPLYPLLIAGVFQVFGIYSLPSAVVLLILNSAFSALTCIPIFLIAQRCFDDDRVAIWTSWIWTLFPPVMAWATRWVWETSFATFLLAMIFWLTLVMEERDGWKPWLLFGFLWGVVGLTNTSLLSFLPASGLWIWYHRWNSGKKSLAGLVLASILFAACVTPWLFRNYQTFGKFIFIRSNFGAELRLGNGPGADGTWQQQLHPTQNLIEMARYKNLGEIAYVDTRQHEAVEYIREDYGRFFGLCMKRFIYYWTGIPRSSAKIASTVFRNAAYWMSSVLALLGLVRALRKRQRGAWLFFWLILIYPAVYYVVFPHPRYRHPIEPELGILMVYGVVKQSR